MPPLISPLLPLPHLLDTERGEREMYLYREGWKQRKEERYIERDGNRERKRDIYRERWKQRKEERYTLRERDENRAQTEEEENQ